MTKFVVILHINTLRPRQDGRHFADDIFTCIFFNENCCILIKFSLKYVRKGAIDNNPALDQIMAWRLSGGKPLSEPMMISLPTHICVTRPQWVNYSTHSVTKHILTNKFQWNLNRNSYIFIQESASENVVWKIAAILTRPQCVNKLKEKFFHHAWFPEMWWLYERDPAWINATAHDQPRKIIETPLNFHGIFSVT